MKKQTNVQFNIRYTAEGTDTTINMTSEVINNETYKTQGMDFTQLHGMMAGISNGTIKGLKFFTEANEPVEITDEIINTSVIGLSIV